MSESKPLPRQSNPSQPPLVRGGAKAEKLKTNQPPSIPPYQGGSLSPSLDKGRAGEGFASDSAFLPYNKTLTDRAREHRKNPTKAESKIWNGLLRMRQLAEYKFLRQKPIDNYIVDFYCSKLRLVIEIDGDSHAETAEYDAERTKILQSLGLSVVRYTNDEVLQNIQGVYDDLLKTIENLLKANQPPSIPPYQGGGLSPSLDKGRAGEGFDGYELSGGIGHNKKGADFK